MPTHGPASLRRHARLTLLAIGLTSHAQQPEPASTLHVSTQLVLVDASVEWKRTGQPLTGLQAADFTLTEDGEPETLTSLSQDTLPLSLAFLFDLTDTVHPVLQHLAGSAADLLRHLRPQDEVAVMTFSSHARLEQRFTRDRMSAIEGIDAASATYDAAEPTFLFEGLWQAAQQSAQSRLPEARRVEIWVTDGSSNDQDTQRALAHHAPPTLHTQAEATTALLRSGAVVGVLLERSNHHGSGRFGELEQLATLTGGPVLDATAGDAATQLATLLDSLRARYTLGYKPTTPRPDGTLCHLHLELSASFWQSHPGLKHHDLVLRARQSYLRSGSMPNPG